MMTVRTMIGSIMRYVTPPPRPDRQDAIAERISNVQKRSRDRMLTSSDTVRATAERALAMFSPDGKETEQ